MNQNLLISILINHVYLSDDLMTPLCEFYLTQKMIPDETAQIYNKDHNEEADDKNEKKKKKEKKELLR